MVYYREERNKETDKSEGIVPRKVKTPRTGSAFGYQLKGYMRRSHIPQRQFADELEVSQAQVSHWVNGRNLPPVDRLLRIPKILELSPEEGDKLLNAAKRAESLSNPGRPKGPMTLDVLGHLLDLAIRHQTEIERLFRIISTELSSNHFINPEPTEIPDPDTQL